MSATISAPALDYKSTQEAVAFVKRVFTDALKEELSLIEIDAPPALPKGEGLQDDLAGTQKPVKFHPTATDRPFEIVHSLAKWKRYQLGRLGSDPGEGLVTLMRAIRQEEEISPIHSIYVDQWDWEQVITPEQRTLDTLKSAAKSVYKALLIAEKAVVDAYGGQPFLDDELTFVHTSELEHTYPELDPMDRETAWVKEHGSSFFIGIGHPLASGKPHDARAADYDDWSTETPEGRGLNGDIVVWHPVLDAAHELSSMGIRVDADALTYQLDHMGQSDYARKPFHQSVLKGKLPQTMGGGIGQSRVTMLLLQKEHIGEVQAGLWPESLRAELASKGITLI